jgi:L-gulonolactone oxidase
MQHGIIATSVIELQLVLASGDVVIASNSQNSDIFKAVLCSMGCLGIITAVTLQVVPAFDLHAKEQPGTLAVSLRNMTTDLQENSWYRFWWFPHTDATWEWRAEAVEPKVHRPKIKPWTVFGCCEVVYPQKLYVASQAWVEWTLFTVFGYHILQAALFLAMLVPFAVPVINYVWQTILFSWKRESIEQSDKVFNFDCLFKQ